MQAQFWGKCFKQKMTRGISLALALVPLLAVATPGQAETIRLSRNQDLPTLRGFIRGTVALHRIVASRDVNNTLCVGFGAPTPDHVIHLEQDFSRLQMQVNSRGQDSTLLIKGPDGKVYCADDGINGSQEAGLVLTNLKSGAYEVWVGSFERGSNFRYTLEFLN